MSCEAGTCGRDDAARIGRRAVLLGGSSALLAGMARRAFATPLAQAFDDDAARRSLRLAAWEAMLDRHRRENRRATACAGGTTRDVWLRHVARVASLPDTARIVTVQRFANACRRRPDRAAFGRNDYWATPRELLRDGGDCEDFAAAKYLALAESGIAGTDLRLVVGTLRPSMRVHAIAMVRVDATAYVLDSNLAGPVTAAEYRAFAPLYAIAGDGMRLLVGGRPESRYRHG